MDIEEILYYREKVVKGDEEFLWYENDMGVVEDLFLSPSVQSPPPKTIKITMKDVKNPGRR